MRTYSFVTTWRFDAPIESVWELIRDYAAWPSWWPEVVRAEQIAPAGADGLGEVTTFVFRTKLPYKLRFHLTTTEVNPPFALAGRASGELQGTGRWRLGAEGATTQVEYFWDVATTRWWMNLLAPLARPLFAWNHDQVMESARRGLERQLSERARSEKPVPREPA